MNVVLATLLVIFTLQGVFADTDALYVDPMDLPKDTSSFLGSFGQFVRSWTDLILGETYEFVQCKESLNETHFKISELSLQVNELDAQMHQLYVNMLNETNTRVELHSQNAQLLLQVDRLQLETQQQQFEVAELHQAKWELTDQLAKALKEIEALKADRERLSNNHNELLNQHQALEVLYEEALELREAQRNVSSTNESVHLRIHVPYFLQLAVVALFFTVCFLWYFLSRQTTGFLPFVKGFLFSDKYRTSFPHLLASTTTTTVTAATTPSEVLIATRKPNRSRHTKTNDRMRRTANKKQKQK